jgi:hypothetical protein
MYQLDYEVFVDQAYESQQKYAEKVGQKGPIDLLHSQVHGELTDEELQFRYAKMIEHLGHMIEETIEARVHIPRRSWKTQEPSFMDSQERREEFVAEMYDVLLFHRAVLAYAGVTGAEFVRVANKKQAYNQTRKDHNINGDSPAPSNPASELQGDCPSSNFLQDLG